MVTPIQTYYVPLREDDLIIDFKGINADAVGNFDDDGERIDDGFIRSLISIAVAAPGTVIWYDHWEDGYDFDYVNSPGATTSVWGDSDTSNNFPNGLGSSVTGIPNDDFFDGGESIILENSIDLDAGAGVFDFDGGDRIVVSFPVAVTRAAYPTDDGTTDGGPGSLLAGAVEVFASDRYGTEFVVPVGVDTSSNTNAFERTSVHIMAAQDNTEVFFDGGSQTINAGETILIQSVEQGDLITSDKPVQATIVVGDVGSSYEMRWYALVPREQWSNEYFTPVFGQRPDNDDLENQEFETYTKVWLYNPNDEAIDVVMSVDGNANFQTINILAGDSALSNAIPNNSGARYFSDDGNFFALTQTDTEGSGQAFDWGHPLISANQLTSQALIGLGYGNTSNDEDVTSYSVVWVTPVQNGTTITVDYDGDGTRTDTFSVDALESIRITDPDDEDMSGATIFATDSEGEPVDIAVAWGQDPDAFGDRVTGGTRQADSLDMGTVVLPLPELTASKSVALFGDVDLDGEVDPGDTLEWTITILNFGQVDLPAGAYNILDDTGFPLSDVFAVSDYDPNSTVYSYDGGSNPVADGSNGATTAFPLDEDGFTNTETIDGRDGANPGETQTLTFRTIVKDFDDLPAGTDFITNVGALRVNNQEDIRFDAGLPIPFQAGIVIEKSTNGDDADDPTGPEIPLGDGVTWTYVVTIPDDIAGDANTAWLKDIIVEDSDSGLIINLVSGDDGDGVLQPGEVWTFEATGTAELGQYMNTGTVTGTPVYGDGETEIDGLDDVTDEDDSHYIGVLPPPTITVDKLNDANDDGTFTDNEATIPGDTVTFQGSITNTSDEDVTITKIEDNLHQAGIDASVSAQALLGTDLAPGATAMFTFEGVIADEDNLTEVNTLTITVEDDEGNEVDDMDTSTVTTPDEEPTITVDKLNDANDDGTFTDNEATIPGDTVTFQGSITNTSDEDVTITKIEDNLHQAGIDASVSAQALLGTDLAPGATAMFTFEGVIADEDNLTEVNTLTITVEDDEGNEVDDMDTSTVTTPGIPSIDLEKLTNGVQGDGGEDVAEIEAGGTVTWTYILTNTGNVDVDESEITVTDDQEGLITDIVDKGDGDGTLAPGEVWVYEKTGIAQDLTTVIDFETDLNGVPLAAGTFITDQYAAAGLNISATEFGAMIFDSANPTGGDFDLATPDLGNILIVSADGDQSDPDDNENGGTITLLWDEPVRFDSTLVLDIEEAYSTIVTYDAEGDLIRSTPIPQTGDGERQLINIGDELVSRIEYNFAGSGATVPEFVFTDIYRNEATVSIDNEVLDRDDSGYVNPAEKPEKKAIEVGIFDAETDTVVQTLTDGAVFSTADLAGDDLTFSARAIAGGALDGEVGSMRLRLTGDGVNISRVENVTPYALFGDANGDLRGGLDLPEGDYVFTVSIYSGGGGKGELLETCFFSFTVSDNPNNPPKAGDDDGFSTPEDTPLQIAAAALLGNDTDPDGDPLTVTQAFGAVGGSVALAGGIATFTPDPDYFGPASFKYEISDGKGGTDVAEVEIDVSPVNDDPVANDDVASTAPGIPIDIAALANDFDPDGNPIEIDEVSINPSEGGVSIVSGGTQIRYTPAPGFTGTAQISYVISDGLGGLADAKIMVDVEEEQEPASLGDRVWLDENKNGIQDLGEDGVEGVEVTLYSAGGSFVGSTTTGADGDYAFINLDPGEYQIEVGAPLGFEVTQADVGGDDTVDSDVDPITYRSGVISLGSGENNDTVDAGLVTKDVGSEPVTLTRTVSFDGEQRGTKDFDTTQGGSDNDLEIGGGDKTGLVFEDVEIAAGAMITDATLILTSQRKQGGGGTADIEIRLFDDADGIPTSGSGVLTDSGFDTFDFVEWFVSDQWFAGTVVETPDLSSLVQDLIDNDPQGDGTYDLAFALDSLSGTRRIEAEEFGDGVAAQLNLTYSVDWI